MYPKKEMNENCEIVLIKSQILKRHVSHAKIIVISNIGFGLGQWDVWSWRYTVALL